VSSKSWRGFSQRALWGVVLWLCLVAPGVWATTLTFDDISGVIGDQYPGVHFSPGWQVWNSVGNPYYPPHSPPNVAYTHETVNYIEWDTDVSNLQVYICCYNGYGNTYTYTVYDAAGLELDSYTTTGAMNYLLVFPISGIRRFVVTGTVQWSNHHTIADMSYSELPTTATPIPPSATPEPPMATPFVFPTATPVPPTATPVPPTATPAPPTATPVPPTSTPVPPTATPVPPTATAVPPTATPAPPTATAAPPTETPFPYPLGVRIDMPEMVHPGDDFWVTGYLDNPGDEIPAAPVFFILDVFGSYYFWPSWAHYPPEVDFQYVFVPYGTTELTVIATFSWPDTGSAEATGLYFYGAMLNEDMTAVLGELAVAEWGYGP